MPKFVLHRGLRDRRIRFHRDYEDEKFVEFGLVGCPKLMGEMFEWMSRKRIDTFKNNGVGLRGFNPPPMDEFMGQANICALEIRVRRKHADRVEAWGKSRSCEIEG